MLSVLLTGDDYWKPAEVVGTVELALGEKGYVFWQSYNLADSSLNSVLVDDDGSFRFEVPTGENIRLIFAAPGYQPRNFIYIFLPGKHYGVKVYLKPETDLDWNRPNVMVTDGAEKRYFQLDKIDDQWRVLIPWDQQQLRFTLRFGERPVSLPSGQAPDENGYFQGQVTVKEGIANISLKPFEERTAVDRTWFTNLRGFESEVVKQTLNDLFLRYRELYDDAEDKPLFLDQMQKEQAALLRSVSMESSSPLMLALVHYHQIYYKVGQEAIRPKDLYQLMEGELALCETAPERCLDRFILGYWFSYATAKQDGNKASLEELARLKAKMMSFAPRNQQAVVLEAVMMTEPESEIAQEANRQLMHEFGDSVFAQYFKKRGQKNELIGQLAPALILVDEHGEKVDLRDYSGRYVFLEFWVSTCTGCRQLMPGMVSLAQQLSELVTTIGVVGDLEGEALSAFAKKHNMTWPQWAAGGFHEGAFRDYRVAGWPSLYLVNPDGQIIGAWDGTQLADPDRLISEVKGIILSKTTQ